MQVAVRVPIEQYSQVQQPFGDGRSFLHHHLEELVIVLHVPALEGVQEVLDRGILIGDGDLNPTLSHDGVGIAQAELGGQQDRGSLAARMQRRRTAGTSATDHEHIRGMSRTQVHIAWNRAVAFEQRGQLAHS